MSNFYIIGDPVNQSKSPLLFNYIFKKILRFKDNAELLFRNFNIKKSSLVYVFGAGLLGRVTRQILKKSNVNTVAFLDNNEYFHNKKCLDLKIIKPELLSRFNANKLKNLQVNTFKL